jgi:Putative Flp pilus-assembly TadE/G-like
MRLKDEEGQVLVLTVLCSTVLLGFMALAIDVGLLFRAKRNLQIAADSAATAAALDYQYNCNVSTTCSITTATNASLVGVGAASNDGVKVGGGTTVAVHCPVQNGPYTNSTCDGYFEAIASQPNPTLFLGLFNKNFSVAVGARAVAGTPYVSTGCVYIQDSTGTLGPNNDSTMYLQGSFNLTAPKCGILINGTSPDTLYFNNNRTNGLIAGSVSAVGGCTNFCTDSSTPIVSGIAPVTNPFQSITPPVVNAGNTSETTNGGSSVPCAAPTGGTKVYQGTRYNVLTGSIAPGCYTGEVYLSNAILSSGVYVFTGDVMLDGTVDGTAGVTMDLNSGGLGSTSGSTFKITAPTTGAYPNIALLAPLTNTSTIGLEFGTATTLLTGIVDMPGANLWLHDSGGGSTAAIITADLVVGTLNDQTGSLTINSYSLTHNTLLKAVALVE